MQGSFLFPDLVLAGGSCGRGGRKIRVGEGMGETQFDHAGTAAGQTCGFFLHLRWHEIKKTKKKKTESNKKREEFSRFL